MIADFLAADPDTSTAFDWVKAVGGLGGTGMALLITFAWFKRLIVTIGELRREQDGREQDRKDFLSVIATKDLQLAAKDDAIEKKDAQLQAATKTLVEETVPALVRATVVMDNQQAELKARRTRNG